MSLLSILRILAIAYLIALAGLYLLQRKIMYHPEGFYTPIAETSADKTFREMDVHTADGLALKAWYAPATSKKLTVVFFHGNGDQLRTAVNIGNIYVHAGYGFLAAEYRGYSGLPGSPTEAGIYNDARTAIKTLITSGVPEKNIVLIGQSIGTGVAVQMATEFHTAGVVLISPYLSTGKVAQARYPIFPCELLIKDRYESFAKIASIKTPLFIAHGERDAIIPVAQGEELFTLAQEPKTFHLFPGAGHNDLFAHGLDTVSLEWLASLSPQ